MTEQLHKNINSSQSTKWDALMDQGNQLLLDGRRYRQLVKYYLSNGNTKIVTESANSEETEGDVPADVVVTEDDVKAVRAMVRNGEIPSNYSRNLLLSINGPLTSNPHIQRGNQIYAVMEKIEKIPEEEEILKYVTNYSPANSHRVTLSSVNDFINQYPTPIDFQRLAKGFMSRFDTSTAEGMDEAKIYNEAMKDFQRKVYGQKYDYYLQMLKLEDDAYKVLRKDLPKLNSQVEYEGERFRITSMNVIAKNCKLENPEHAIVISLDELIAKGKYNKPVKKEEKGEESVAE